MKHNFEGILNEILTITAYPDDKKAFIQQFNELNIIEATMNIYEKLPKDMQEKVKLYAHDSEKVRQYIPAALFTKELEKVTKAALQEFIKSISMELVPAQKNKIAELIASY